MATRYTFHILPNAHLDPVWLWDWREGLNEGLNTTRTILDLMDEYPELTFMRGEAALYQHIEQSDPSTFSRLSKQIAAGRWEVVGGTMVQPDTNLPATETLARHLLLGQRYFRQRFGRRIRVAWAADSFGHTAGLPEILAAAGLEGFSFSRPDFNNIRMSMPAFWWEAASGARVLAYRVPVGWYGVNRDEAPKRLDDSLAEAAKSPLSNIGVYMGLGNHGGGPTRRHLEEIRKWAAAHPEVKVVYSGLHRLIDAIRREAARKGESFLPVRRGELNYCLRGCYVSMARFKYAYRRAEAAVSRAETVDTAVSVGLGRSCAPLDSAWQGVLFNSFHDILPGSSIERAYGEQLEWLGGAVHTARQAEFNALNALVARVDTRVPPVPPDHPSAVSMLVFNPHPYEYRGPLELEAALDYRPITSYQGRPDEVPIEVRGADRKPLPHQVVATEHAAFEHTPWRKRVVVQSVLPPMGWSVFELGWVEGAIKPKVVSSVMATSTSIANGYYRVDARTGGRGIRVLRKGKSVLGGKGLHLVTVEDPWGSWGGLGEEAASLNLSKVLHEWKVTTVEALEKGPERAMLWVRLEGGASWMELSFSLCRGRDAVDVQARLVWNERSSRLKLVMPAGGQAEFEVPGGVVKRGDVGDVPGGRWVRVKGPRGSFGFASDALYGFECRKGVLVASLVRATRYASDTVLAAQEIPWRPATDQGEHLFKFIMSPGYSNLPELAEALERPPVIVMASPGKGSLPRKGSILALEPSQLRLLAFKPAEEGQGYVLRAQAPMQAVRSAAVILLGRRLKLGALRPGEIATWRIRKAGAGWAIARTDIGE